MAYPYILLIPSVSSFYHDILSLPYQHTLQTYQHPLIMSIQSNAQKHAAGGKTFVVSTIPVNMSYLHILPTRPFIAFSFYPIYTHYKHNLSTHPPPSPRQPQASPRLLVFSVLLVVALSILTI